MRSRDLSRFALSICAVVVMLAGCGGSSRQSVHRASCHKHQCSRRALMGRTTKSCTASAPSPMGRTPTQA